MSPEPTPPAQSPIALVALIMGVLGLCFSALGCFLWPFMLVGAALSLVGMVLGYVEYRKIESGQSAASNRTYAVTGIGTGAGGCALGCLYGIVVGLLFAAYVAFILLYFVLMVGLIAAGGG